MTQPRRQRITFDDVGDVTVVRFVDRKILDEPNIQAIGDDLFKLVDELGRRKVLLDFSTVEFMSSAALGKLIKLHQRLHQVGGKLVMCSISKGIMEIFEITKLDKMFNFAKTEQDGLTMF